MTEEEKRKLETVLVEGYTLSTSRCMQEGLRLYISQFRLFAQYALLVVMVGLVLGLLWPSIYQTIAFTIFVSPVFNAGYYLAADRLVMDTEALKFGDFLGGMSHPFPLILNNVIYWLMLLALLTPAYLVLQDAGVLEWYQESMQEGELQGEPPQVSGQGPTILFLSLLPIIYLTVAFAWAYPLILFFRMRAWSALEWSRRLIGKHWWRICWLFFSFTGLVLTISLFFNLITALIPAAAVLLQLAIALVMPWFYCTMYAAFARATIAVRANTEAEEPIE